MAYLEELLPNFRKGAKIRRECWSLIKFVHIKKGKIVDEDGNHIDFTDESFISNDWELYQEPEPDWQYIIDNKCLCWFWDDDDTPVEPKDIPTEFLIGKIKVEVLDD
jgi:hypothetical protein